MTYALKILVIEDSEVDFRLIERHLRQNGIDAALHRVDSGEALEAALDGGRWDIILSDNAVPKMDFEDTFARVHARFPDLPVITVSGSLGEERAVELLRLGVSDFVLKDNLVRLVPAIDRCLRDVAETSARRNAEAALLASEERFKLAMQGANDGLWDWNILTNEVYYSPRWKSMLGYADDELENVYENWERLLHPEDRPPALAHLRDFLDGRVPRFEAEFRMRHKDGHYVDILSRGFPVLGDWGERLRLIGTHMDVTNQKKLEMQYLHAQKMESIGTLAGGVAHDFNNILMVIVSLGHLMMKDMGQDDPHRSHVGGILEAAERAAHLTRQLLLFSRKQRSERKPADLNEVVSGIDRFLRRIIGEDIVLKQVMHGSKLPIFADANQLDQVLMNLAVNARDAMSEGGEFILRTERVSMRENFVTTHGYGKPGEYALLTVSDTGTGMDKGTLERIFEPFFSTKEVGKGTGLGLAVVYGIIKQHDGFISVYSEPGQGSTFRIYLPLTAEERRESAAREERPVTGGDETILLAEDDDMVRAMVTTVLKGAGYSVITAVNGEDAVRKFRENADSIRLLLFDLIMPIMNGKEASDEIHGMNPAVKTIFASGYSPDIARRKAPPLANCQLVFKPVPPRELLRMVRKVLDGTP